MLIRNTESAATPLGSAQLAIMTNVDLRQQIDAFIAAGDARGGRRVAWKKCGGPRVVRRHAGFIASRYDRIRREPRATALPVGVPALFHGGTAGADAQGGGVSSAASRWKPMWANSTPGRRRCSTPPAPSTASSPTWRCWRCWRATGAGKRAGAAYRLHRGFPPPQPGGTDRAHTGATGRVPAAGMLDAQQPDGEAEGMRADQPRTRRTGDASTAASTCWITTRWWPGTAANTGATSASGSPCGCPSPPRNLPHLAAEWLRFLHPLAGKVAKCVAVDLDNTLWGGVIGEDGMTRHPTRAGVSGRGLSGGAARAARSDQARHPAGGVQQEQSGGRHGGALRPPRHAAAAARFRRHADQLEPEGAEPARDRGGVEHRAGQRGVPGRQSGRAPARSRAGARGDRDRTCRRTRWRSPARFATAPGSNA